MIVEKIGRLLEWLARWVVGWALSIRARRDPYYKIVKDIRSGKRKDPLALSAKERRVSTWQSIQKELPRKQRSAECPFQNKSKMELPNAIKRLRGPIQGAAVGPGQSVTIRVHEADQTPHLPAETPDPTSSSEETGKGESGPGKPPVEV